MLEARDASSHTYDEELANDIYQKIQKYVPII